MILMLPGLLGGLFHGCGLWYVRSSASLEASLYWRMREWSRFDLIDLGYRELVGRSALRMSKVNRSPETSRKRTFTLVERTPDKPRARPVVPATVVP